MNAWQTVALGEATTITGGGTPTRNNTDYYGGTIPWVTPKDMKSWEIHRAQVNITEVGLESSAARLVPPNSVLIVVRSGVLKHTIPVALNRVPVAINQDMKALRCSGSLDPDFLARFIKAQSSEILQWVRATTADNFPIDMLKQLRVPVPPLAEQRRIAEVLNRAEALRAKRRAVLAQLDTLTQSIFLDLFGDPATNPNGFSKGNIEVAVKDPKKDIRCGPFGTQLKVHELVDSGIPLLGIENVLDEGFRPESRKFLTDMKAKELRAFDVAPGDVLVTRMGTIGRSCVVPETFTGGRFSYHLFRIRPDIARCVPEFLAATISKSGTFQAQLRNYAHGAIMAGLNTTDLKAVQFLVPPIQLQREFVAAVAAIEKLRASHRASLAELDALFATLQHHAFRGEL